MGSACSPALCVGTLAWMEQTWMDGLGTEEKERFRMGRYMDDVLTVVARNDREWDADKFLREFESSTCYWPPLRLERADESCFLETKLVGITRDGHFSHQLKNVNEGRATQPMVWRYQRWDSFGSTSVKTGVLMGCLMKVEKMASDELSFRQSLAHKVQEFKALGYPSRVLKAACARMHERIQEGSWHWFRAKDIFEESRD